jgi:hypothetical protein
VVFVSLSPPSSAAGSHCIENSRVLHLFYSRCFAIQKWYARLQPSGPHWQHPSGEQQKLAMDQPTIRPELRNSSTGQQTFYLNAHPFRLRVRPSAPLHSCRCRHTVRRSNPIQQIDINFALASPLSEPSSHAGEETTVSGPV